MTIPFLPSSISRDLYSEALKATAREKESVERGEPAGTSTTNLLDDASKPKKVRGDQVEIKGE